MTINQSRRQADVVVINPRSAPLSPARALPPSSGAPLHRAPILVAHIGRPKSLSVGGCGGDGGRSGGIGAQSTELSVWVSPAAPYAWPAADHSCFCAAEKYST